MTDLNDATELEDRIDVWAQTPIVEKAASDQLAKTRVRVDRYTLEPKQSETMP